MQSVIKPWPWRLLAAATALALLIASLIGTYAHAVGHELPQAVHAADACVSDRAEDFTPNALEPAVPHAAAYRAAGATYDGDKGDEHQDGQDWADSDTICHGGQAILPSALPVHPPLPIVPLTAPATALDGTEPANLDRPPKAFPSA